MGGVWDGMGWDGMGWDGMGPLFCLGHTSKLKEVSEDRIKAVGQIRDVEMQQK